MATNIISAVRGCDKLRGNTFLIATELAHRMNGSGFGRVSYQYLAWKAHCAKRTAERQIARLVDDVHLFRKTVIRTKYGNAWNLYQYIGPRVPTAFSLATTHNDSLPRILPDPEREKDTALHQEIEQLRKGLRFLTNPDSPMYQACLDKITALEALRRPVCP